MAFFARPASASAAVRIVNPNTQNEAVQPPRKDSAQRRCRNVMIYGYCKFEDKGCVYYHPPVGELIPAPARSVSPAATTTHGTSPISAHAVNAPVFVPKASSLSLAISPPSTPVIRQPVASSSPSSPAPPDYHQSTEHYAYSESEQMAEFDAQFYDDSQAHFNGYSAGYAQNMEVPFYTGPTQVYMNEPLDHHLYTPAIPSAFVSSTTGSHFIHPTPELRQTLQERSHTSRSATLLGSNLPEELQGYHSFVLIDTVSSPERKKFFNLNSVVYRAINSNDGIPYVLRRIENFRLMQQAAFNAIEAWSHIRHPNIVPVHEAFTTRTFNDSSLVVVYSYYPNSQTLFEAHLKSTIPSTLSQYLQNGGGRLALGQSHSLPQLSQYGQPLPSPFTSSQSLRHLQSSGIPERILWSYIVQIASAIKRVHEAGLAVRTIDATKILLTGKNRVRIGSCAVWDVLTYDQHLDVVALQHDDLQHFGRLIFALCCNNPQATTNGNFQKSLEIISKTYSHDVKSIALYLISKNHPHKNINTVFETISGRLLTELDDALEGMDCLENEMLSELENARLVRLLCKFGFINERPEFARDSRWSETGDRYIIKLFRDYVFHQIDEHGNPVTNMSHVLTCLNKLDAGTEEKIMLVARDEQSCLVVSYKEIKACVEAAFSELSRAR
ncbi:kinase-like domain-containing protein [Lentinula aciculospora]|uniref:PAN2-PAN3 deadenylation complex subunit PAN3 n=1 Tax=Lentinula aciculospora TaxID=153920 RepID=A0A9W9AG34_9AGAR|nr:kinase-like domain-containing protein [Lentinula aciculospora]